MIIRHIFVYFFIILLLNSCAWTQQKESKITTLPHHTSNGFKNYPETKPMPSKGFMFFLRRIKHSMFLDKAPKSHYLSQDDAIRDYNNSKDSDTITWLGHSAFLIKLDGKVILTDPFLSTYASPVPVFGPRRIVPLGIKLEDFPKIDIIILSHNHYDHLNGYEDLKDKQNIKVLTPLNNSYLFENEGFKDIKELDWEDNITTCDLQFFLHSAVHNSRRGAFDSDKSLWGSWVIKSHNKTIFFSGDTAYSPTIFNNIGKIHKHIDYAFVPIGAYEPREVMNMIHTNPSEAVQIGVDLNASKLIGMHWGTLNLSDEPMFEPPKLFKKAGKKANKDTIVLKIGQTIKI